MMKKILAMAAVAALAAGASVYAANPFSDVSTSDWAYQAVADLSDQGVVEGYPDGTFKGENNITRYEMAQIIARLMAKEDQLNAEQRATVDKLAGEYADELDNLGVRVSNLEKKVGNISWSGDARMRYQSKDNSADENWDGRIRLNMKAQVNDSTTVNGRFTSNMNFQNGDDAETYMDVLNVKHQFGDTAALTLGRYGISFGDQGGWLFGDSHGFDGVQADFDLGPVDVSTGYGQFNAGNLKNKDGDDADVYYAKAKANLGFAAVGADYISFKDKFVDNTPEVWGVNLTVPVDQFRVFGEYWQNTTASDYDTAWNAGIGYGKLDLKKAGTYTIDVAYNDVDKNVYGGGTGLNTDILDSLAYSGKSDPTAASHTKHQYDNISFWNAIAEVTLAQNTYLHAEYAFGADSNKDTDPEDTWAVSLNYKF